MVQHTISVSNIDRRKLTERAVGSSDVTVFNNEVATYQVKKHHHGGSSFVIEATGPDIRELFCYKLLELIEVKLFILYAG